MRHLFAAIEPTADERRQPRPGDEVVSPADVVMDRAFTLEATPERVWPWLEQLGKGRAGWYLPRSVERVIPRSNRALRQLDPTFLGLRVGDVVPDYGGAHETLEVAAVEAPRYIVYRSQRGRTRMTWTLTLEPREASTRICLRLRLAPVKRVWLAKSVGELFDALTIAGLAAGLRERLADAGS